MKAFILFTILVVFSVCVDAGAIPDHESEYNETTCPKRCSIQYNPICGLNADNETEVFVNDCYMSYRNCGSPKNKVFYKCDPQNCPQYSEWIDEDSPNQVE